MGQKRFNGILKGDYVMTDEECKRIADYFGISYESLLDARQIELFKTDQ